MFATWLCVFICFATGHLHTCFTLDVLMGLIKSKQLDCIFCFISYWNFKCLPLGFVCLFVLPLGFCTFDLLWTPLVVARVRLKILVLFLFLPAQGDIAFAQISSTLQNPELRRLASSLPARALQSKAPRTD